MLGRKRGTPVIDNKELIFSLKYLRKFVWWEVKWLFLYSLFFLFCILVSVSFCCATSHPQNVLTQNNKIIVHTILLWVGWADCLVWTGLAGAEWSKKLTLMSGVWSYVSWSDGEHPATCFSSSNRLACVCSQDGNCKVPESTKRRQVLMCKNFSDLFVLCWALFDQPKQVTGLATESE